MKTLTSVIIRDKILLFLEFFVYQDKLTAIFFFILLNNVDSFPQTKRYFRMTLKNN